MPVTAKHGTTRRYRVGCKCSACTLANTRAKSRQRARAKQRSESPLLSIVLPVLVDGTPLGVSVSESVSWSSVAYAVRADLEGMPVDTPFLASLSALALSLAREVDGFDEVSAVGKGSRSPAAKQLTDVIRELKGTGGADGDSFADLVSLLGSPLVPSVSAEVSDAP